MRFTCRVPVACAFAVCALAALLLAGACGTGSGNVIEPAAGSQTADPDQSTPTAPQPEGEAGSDGETAAQPERPRADLAAAGPGYRVIVEQVDCPDEIEDNDLACALASVPIDRSNLDAGTTDISFGVLQGSDEFPTALAVLQGGPGAASTDATSSYPFRDYAQVFVDQRGTGFGSSNFDCPEFEETLAEALAAPAEAAKAILLQASRRCAERLADDPVLEATDSDAHAADVADVMAALGHESWIVYGVSYGTNIALELLRDEPEGLVGAVLDGVYPPDIDPDRELANSAVLALNELARACAAAPRCAAISSDVTAVLDELMVRLDATPLIVQVPGNRTSLGSDVDVWIDGDSLAGLVFQFLYNEQRAGLIPGLLDGLARGDEATAGWLARAAVDLAVEDSFIIEGSYFAVRCAEDLHEASGPSSEFGAYAAAVVGSGARFWCAGWDLTPTSAETAQPVRSDLPVLMLSGRFDPITPASLAERAARNLPAATHVIRDGRGHGLWPDVDCIDDIVDAFIDDPTGLLDTACAAEPVPLQWGRPA